MAEQSEKNGKRDEDNSEFRNFQRLLEQVVSVPKEKIVERRAEEKREKKKRRAG